MSTFLPTPLCVDDFVWGKKIGRGAFSDVYVVKHKGSGESCPYVVKVIRKRRAVERKMVARLCQERAIALEILNEHPHPYLARYNGAFHDERCLYFVSEFVSGGDLFGHLRRLVRFKRRTAEFYAAQILIVLEHLHSLDIVYRDLKPENICLNRRGYIKLIDFGLSKRLRRGERTYTVCGSPEYMAPEILLGTGHTEIVDWWALGIILYEMIVGQPPFVARDPMDVYKLVIRAKVLFPSKSLRIVDDVTKSMIKKLLEFDETKRYGSGFKKSGKIRSHPFFQGMKWESLETQKLGSMEGAIVPAVSSAVDTSQFPKNEDEEATKSESSLRSSNKSTSKAGTQEKGSAATSDGTIAKKKGDAVEFLDKIKREPVCDILGSDPFAEFD